jgi:formamidopyrimidine-DNA glycosylase
VPELPETETIAQDLRGLIAGRSIAGVEVLRPDVLRGVRPRSLAAKLSGRSIVKAWRRAKTVVLDLSGGTSLLVTPRFTGSLQVSRPDEYATLVLTLDDGRSLVYRDVRRLGTVAVVDAEGFRRFDQRLGVEPLTPAFTAAAFSGIVRTPRSAIKKVLMDQRRIAGIGNIYATEVLWRARIDPSRPARTLAPTETAVLRDQLVDLLEAAIALRGTTFRDYRDARNERGRFADQLHAYGRGGKPCPRCGTRLAETWAIDGRSTVFCFRCQG